jgi:RNA polymerase sigma-70 factor, ECF subfamily
LKREMFLELKDQQQQIVHALKRGRMEAFDSLVRLHQHKVYGLCLRMLGNQAEAEDVAQEVFISVLRSIKQFREECQLSTWIFRITRNHCLNRLKFLRRRAYQKGQPLDETKESDECGSALGSPFSGQVPRPDRALEQKQLEIALEEKINSLSDEHRELIILRDIEQMSYEEIQAITGLPEGTIKSRLHRARAELARAMTPYFKQE